MGEYSYFLGKNVGFERWALRIIMEVIREKRLRKGVNGVRVKTYEVEEAALRLGMARGTGRAALSVLKGLVERVGRGEWVVRVRFLAVEWPGQALEELAGVKVKGLKEAREIFLKAVVRGWRGERENVRALTARAFRELWERIRERGCDRKEVGGEGKGGKEGKEVDREVGKGKGIELSEREGERERGYGRGGEGKGQAHQGRERGKGKQYQGGESKGRIRCITYLVKVGFSGIYRDYEGVKRLAEMLAPSMVRWEI